VVDKPRKGGSGGPKRRTENGTKRAFTKRAHEAEKPRRRRPKKKPKKKSPRKGNGVERAGAGTE